MNLYPLYNFDNPYTDRYGRLACLTGRRSATTYADEHEDQSLFHSPQIYSDPIFMIAFRNQMNFWNICCFSCRYSGWRQSVTAIIGPPR